MTIPKKDDFILAIGVGVVAFGLQYAAQAQQLPASDDPVLLREVANVLQQQRNQAQNDVAVLNAMLARANARIKDLEKPSDSGGGSGK